jgi:hypothetical protein
VKSACVGVLSITSSQFYMKQSRRYSKYNIRGIQICTITTNSLVSFISFVRNVVRKFIIGVIIYQFLPSAFVTEKYSGVTVT